VKESIESIWGAEKKDVCCEITLKKSHFREKSNSPPKKTVVNASNTWLAAMTSPLAKEVSPARLELAALGYLLLSSSHM
jgi:hypothetical protein